MQVAGAILILVLHSVEDLDLDPAAEGFHAVVSGHTHKPGFRWKDGVLYVNPGSAGPRRFSLPISVARLVIDDGDLSFDVTEFAGNPP